MARGVSFLAGALLLLSPAAVKAVKEIATHAEFTKLLQDAKADGRPVIIDYFSESCGPCHMIAPVFRRIAKEYAGKAFFRKVDVDRNQQTSGQQGIRSMPTFQFYLKGKKRHQLSGADENGIRQWTKLLVEEFERDDVDVTMEALEAFYKKHDPSKATPESLQNIMDKNKNDLGKMARLLSKKYGEAPETKKRERPTPSQQAGEGSPGGKAPAGASLKTATTEELRQELEGRDEAAAMDRLESEELRLSHNPCSSYRNRTRGSAVEKVVIIGGGPAGMTAAIYAARANLCPLLIAPAMGGQLMAKGVDVENYPGLPRENGGKMIETMKQQARSFFTEVWDDTVLSVDTSSKPYKLTTNSSGVVMAHTLIISTGADSRWLDAEGEYDLRGKGVSSCAACDGYLYRGKVCAVIGGGDTAMEEALMLSRICSNVQLIHRRDSFRASLVLQHRVLNNPNINVRWNSAIAKYVGKDISVDGETQVILGHVELSDTTDATKERTVLPVDAAFVAIGHDPNTKMMKGLLDMDEQAYITTPGGSTKTSLPGVFAAGDVADKVYRQAVTSAGSGAMAALDVEKHLSENEVDEEKCVRQDDFSSHSMKELRAMVKALDVKCTACTEKGDFAAALREAF